MKKLEIIIKPERLEVLKEILSAEGVSGIMVTNIMGYGNQKGRTQSYRGVEYGVNMLPKLRVETVVPDEKVAQLMQLIQKNLSTGSIGDGKIFVYHVEDAMRIRTGEMGEAAI